MKQSRTDEVFDRVNVVLSTLVLALVLYPIIFMISASVSNPSLVALGKVYLWPREPSLEGYRAVFRYQDIWVGYRNTILYTIGGTLIGLFLSLTAAYPLSHKDLPGRKLVLLFMTVTMFFSGGLVPTYLVVKRLGMRNTVFAQILLGGLSFFYVIVARTFFQESIPPEIKEAAVIDGCGYTRTFASVVLPLAKPLIAVLGLYYAANQWNSYFNALIYISDRRLYPLQLYLREILVMNEINASMLQFGLDEEVLQRRADLVALLRYAVVIVSTLPIIAVYPFLQRFFVKGVMIGAIKG